jgi:NADP-dependent 3-hydroxy acid dehydrogenase YdfG
MLTMGVLNDKIALVTGGGSGIGAAAAIALAGEGATVVVAGRREAPLLATVAAIEAAGGKGAARVVDLEDGDAAAALGTGVLKDFGQLDILVNNAGHSSQVRTLSHVDPHEFESVFKVNVTAVYRLTQSVLESMVARGEGTVITVASMAGVSANLLGGVAYGSAKAAVINMMNGLNAELRNKGIRATSIMPGEANTDILDNRPLPPDAATREHMMQPEDVAEAIRVCATLPQRTVIEQILMRPTRQRDTSADLAAAAAKRSPQ